MVNDEIRNMTGNLIHFDIISNTKVHFNTCGDVRVIYTARSWPICVPSWRQSKRPSNTSIPARMGDNKTAISHHPRAAQNVKSNW